MNTLAKKINDSKWQFLEIFCIGSLQLLYLITTSRNLTSSDFGLFAITNSIVLLGNIVSEGGFGSYLIFDQRIKSKHISASFQASILISTLFYLFTTQFFKIKFFNIDDQILNLYLPILSINFFLIGLNNINSSLLLKKLEYRKNALIILFCSIIGYSTGILMVLYQYGIWSLIVATITTNSVKLFIYFYVLKHNFFEKVSFNYFKDLFSFSLNLTIIKIINYSGNNVFNFIINIGYGSSMLGSFDRANRLLTLPATHVGSFIDKMVFPRLVKHKSNNNFSFLLDLYKIILSFCLPIVLILMLWNNEIIDLLMGEGWYDSKKILFFLSFTFPFLILNKFNDSILRSLGLLRENLIRKFIYFLLLVFLFVVFKNSSGIYSICISLFISNAISVIMFYLIIRSKLKNTNFQLTIKDLQDFLPSLIVILTWVMYFYLSKYHLGIYIWLAILLMIIFAVRYTKEYKFILGTTLSSHLKL